MPGPLKVVCLAIMLGGLSFKASAQEDNLIINGILQPVNLYNVVKPFAPTVITTTGAPSTINTLYGDTSPSASFNIYASGLTAGVSVTPPIGFEVSIDNITFSNSVTIGNGNDLNSAPLFIRLAATTDAGTYGGDIVLTSGSTNIKVAMPGSVVSPAPITITTKDVTKHYGEALFISSTGTGTFTVTGTLKNGDQVIAVSIVYGAGYSSVDNTGTYPGSVIITAIAGNASFKLSNYKITKASGSIIVLPAPLTIKLNDITKIYGMALINGNSSKGFIATGLQNLQSIDNLMISYGSGASASSPLNRYAGSVIGASPVGSTFTPANYSPITYVSGDIIVNAVPLVITANDASKDQGAVNPIFTATYTGFVNNEDASILSKQSSLSTQATTSSRPGTYPINVSGASAINYTITYLDGELTINALPVITLFIPNTFTPNGDGVNDTWEINSITNYPNCTVNIFNCYGQNVYASIGYPSAWTGQYNGKPLPGGTYYYIIDLKNENKALSGSITLIR